MDGWANILGDWPEDIVLRYNVSPTQIIPAFLLSKDKTRTSGMGMRWGLVPSWCKRPATEFATFNPRSETVTEKPAFRSA